MKGTIYKYILTVFTLLICIVFVIKFAGPKLLRFYVEAGLGDCKNQPIFCITPAEEIITGSIDKDYLASLDCYKFTNVEICAPKEFTIIKERISKVYYKKKPKDAGSTIYLLYEKPNFFIDLFPQLNKRGIKNDYEFIESTMYAKVNEITSFSDAFFVIMKSIFTPDLGNQRNLKMGKFKILDKKGFINYNLDKSEHYFDCNIINNLGDFFKIYIKDKNASLSLDKVMTIISTVNKPK